MRLMVLCRTDLAVNPVLGRELEAEVRAETNQGVDWRRRAYQSRRTSESMLNRSQGDKWMSPSPVRNDNVVPLLNLDALVAPF